METLCTGILIEVEAEFFLDFKKVVVFWCFGNGFLFWKRFASNHAWQLGLKKVCYVFEDFIFDLAAITRGEIWIFQQENYSIRALLYTRT